MQEKFVDRDFHAIGSQQGTTAPVKSSLMDKAKYAVALVAIVAVISYAGITAMVLQHESAFFSSRYYALDEMSKGSPEDRAVADAYRTCLKTKQFNEIGATCALEAVAVARSQGRSEIQVANVMSKIGIFETGCSPDAVAGRDVVSVSQELSRLRTTWCSQQQPKPQE